MAKKENSKENLFEYLSGLGTLPERALFEITLDEEFLTMNQIKFKVFGKNDILQQYKIKSCDILALDIVKKAELENQSVIGRGAVGGLLFGPVGAVLGGMSATSKQKIKSTLAISYLPSSGNEPKTIIFADDSTWSGANTLSVSKMKERLTKIPKSARAMKYLGQTINQDGSITL